MARTVVKRLPGPGVCRHLCICLSAARASVAVALLLGRGRLLRSRRARSAAHGKSDSSLHGFERTPASGDGLACALVEGRGLRSSGDADGDAGGSPPSRFWVCFGWLNGWPTRRLRSRPTLCTALYPVFFAQSSLAQVDLAAAGLIFWALAAYVEDETIATTFWFSLAALAKETAILAPMALAAWEILGLLARKSSLRKLWREGEDREVERQFCAAHRLAAGPRDAAGSLVCLSLRAHWIRLRQSGILPLQRGCDSQLHVDFFLRWPCGFGRSVDISTCGF